MLRFVESLREDIPTIIMGNFNIPEGDMPYQLLADKDQNKMGFIDSKYSSRFPHAGPVATFNGFSDEVIRKEAIDFIFVNERIETRSHATLEIKEGSVFVSDHYPVMISADLR